VTDHEIIEIEAAARVTTDRGILGHRVPPWASGAEADAA
jgi:hypothetical protein